MFRAAVSIIVMIGVGLMIYPETAQWLEQREQSRIISLLNQAVSSVPEEHRDALWDQAQSYNEALASGANPATEYEDTLGLPAVTTMSRLRIPAINLDQPIRHGMSETVLTTGLGHLKGSSLPVGGVPSNTVIGGHRGLAKAVGFTHLDGVSQGDTIILETLGQILTYTVESIVVLPPGEAEMQPIYPGRDVVTLVTCTPLGLNTDRLVVTAERVFNEAELAEKAGAESELPAFPWWMVKAGVTILACAVYTWMGRSRNHPTQRSSGLEPLDPAGLSTPTPPPVLSSDRK